MNDQAFFTQALGVQAPWNVQAVRMDVAARRVEVELACAQTIWADPETKQRLHVHGYESRQWRHLDTMQFETIIVARVPRLKYPDGHTELLPVAWAEPHSRHTLFLKLGPSRFWGPASPSPMAAGSCGSTGKPRTTSWSAPWRGASPAASSTR